MLVIILRRADVDKADQQTQRAAQPDHEQIVLVVPLPRKKQYQADQRRRRAQRHTRPRAPAERKRPARRFLLHGTEIVKRASPGLSAVERRKGHERLRRRRGVGRAARNVRKAAVRQAIALQRVHGAAPILDKTRVGERIDGKRRQRDDHLRRALRVGIAEAGIAAVAVLPRREERKPPFDALLRARTARKCLERHGGHVYIALLAPERPAAVRKLERREFADQRLPRIERAFLSV